MYNQLFPYPPTDYNVLPLDEYNFLDCRKLKVIPVRAVDFRVYFDLGH